MRRRRGSALLMALLVTAVALAVSLNVATVITLGVRGSIFSKDAMDVFYRAESGLERALFRVRQLKVPAAELAMKSNCDCDNNCVAISGCSVSAAYAPGLMGLFDSPWVLFKQDQSIELDLLDTTVSDPNDPKNQPECSYDEGGTLSKAACISTVKIGCTDSGGGTIGSLVVTATQVAGSSGWGPLTSGDPQGVSQAVCYCSGSYGTCTAKVPFIPDLQQAYSYILRIRAVQSDVKIVFVRAYGEGSGQRDLSDTLELTASAGTFQVEQEVKAKLFGRPHVAGMFDYVLYSECGIDKTIPLGSQPCP